MICFVFTTLGVWDHVILFESHKLGDTQVIYCIHTSRSLIYGFPIYYVQIKEENKTSKHKLKTVCFVTHVRF
jgi:hypothetical protein